MKNRMRSKFMTVILTLAMIVSLMPAVTQPAKALEEGTSLAGAGTPEDPFLIETAADLSYMRTQVNSGADIQFIDESGETQTAPAASASYRLTADIALNENAEEYESWDTTAPANAWTPIGTGSGFTGIFDGGIYNEDGGLGGYHTISGMYINNSSADSQGLFAHVANGGLVKNLAIAGSYISGKDMIGGVAGSSFGTVQNCCNVGSIHGSNSIGAIVGLSYGTVQNCYNVGSIHGINNIGGVVGGNGDKVQICYNAGAVSGTYTIGGVVGGNNATVQNCYNAGDVSDGSYVGGIAGSNASGTVQDCFYDSQMCTCAYGIGTTLSSDGAEGRPTAQMTGENLKTGDSGEGWTPDNWIFTSGLYPRLTCMSDTDAAYVSASPVFLRNDSDTVNSVFSTGFAVGGRENGVSWTSSSSDVTLHGDNGYILNDRSFTLTASKGGVSRTVALSAAPKLRVVDMSAVYSAGNPLAVGYPSDLAYVAYKVNGDANVAYIDGGGADNTAPAATASYLQIADIVLGYWRDDDSDGSVGEGEIYEDAAYGAPASNWTPIGNSDNCFSGTYDGGNRTVSGIYINNPYSHYQGLFGVAVGGGKIQNVGVTDNYISGLDRVGGVVAWAEIDVLNCYHTGSVNGRSAVGGVVGGSYLGDVKNCYNTGSVIGGYDSVSVGGVVGGIVGTVQFCYNTGSVSGDTAVGGVAGHFVHITSTMQYCYNAGAVSGETNVGGVAGYNNEDARIQYCCSTGTVSGSSSVGGIAGKNTGTVQNCWYDRQMCACACGIGDPSGSDGAEGRLTLEMTGENLLTAGSGDGWTSDNWTFASGLYPRLFGMSGTDAAYVSASPVFLTTPETAAAVNTNFTVSTENGVSWASSDADIVRISAAGEDATVIDNGDAALTASVSGISKTVNLTVMVPTVSPTWVIFDKYPGDDDFENISVDMALNGSSLTGIYNDTQLLAEHTDYTVSGSTVVLPVSYLRSLPLDETTLTFQFSAGKDKTLRITVSDSTPPDYTNYYHVTFETVGGGEISSVRREKNSKIDLSGYTPAREGYTFTGWYADAGYTEGITSIVLTEDTTVYAGWEWNNPFADVSEDAWYYGDVERAYQNGLMNGTASDIFNPGGTMTRSMFVTVLYRLSGDAGSYMCTFPDVPSGEWYENAAGWAEETGIVSGLEDGSFSPDGGITREQLAVMLWRHAKYRGYDVSVGGDTNMLSYGDASDVSDYAYAALQWACGAGIINGDESGNLNPQSAATRAEVAAMLHRFTKVTTVNC